MTIVFCCCACFFSNIFAEEKEVPLRPYELDKLLRNIKSATKPIVTDDYIIFTAKPTSRYVGIAFDFENYQTVHPFKVLYSTDEDNKKTPMYLFYCYKRTHKISEINYRLIIDGLWTVDPLNPDKEYDEDINLYFSKVKASGEVLQNTSITSDSTVKFVYKGQSGLTIRLAGTFCSWDPWIYELKETRPGFYELELPLPDGKYYYNYFVGLDSMLDTTNPQRAYLKNGKAVSVIQVD